MVPEFIRNPGGHWYKSDNYVVLDFETAGATADPTDPNNRLILGCYTVGQGHADYKLHGPSVMCVVGGVYDMAPVLAAIASSDFVVAHNSRFELHWLSRCGLDIANVLTYDTMVAEYVLGGNRYTNSALSLDACLDRHGLGQKEQTVKRWISSGVPVDTIPTSLLVEYCKLDVETTLALFQYQMDVFKEQLPRLLPIVFTRCITIPVLCALETTGMQLDPEVVRITLQEETERHVRLSAELSKIAPGVNLSSNKQKAVLLYDVLKFEQLKEKVGGKWVSKTTPGGGPLTSVDAILSLRCTNPLQRSFVKALSEEREAHYNLQMLTKFRECCDTSGGVIYAEILQGTTSTHRLSSRGKLHKIQLQNLARRFKRLFKARTEGWKLLSADGAAIEFRCAGHLGRDTNILEDLLNKVDVHSKTASIVGVSRQEAKSHTFKPLYGGKKGSRKEMEYYQYFREHYRGITRTQQRWIDYALAHKYIETEWGLRYYFPDIRAESSGYVVGAESICNWPVQCFATGEIIPICLTFLWYDMRASGLRSFVVNTVHDSIDIEVHPEEEQHVVELVKSCMLSKIYTYLDAVYGVKLTVPLGCGVKIAEHWGDTEKEVKYEADSSLWACNKM